jgi:ABC-type Fe3+-hydroxamate transport system substrate-binding protein
VVQPERGARIVSLVPSVTETLLAWGVEPLACTRFCEQPDLPHVGGTKDPDVDAIVALRPDLVVMCVEENRIEDADALAEAGVATAALTIESVGDVEVGLRVLAGLVGHDMAGRAVTAGSDPAPPRDDLAALATALADVEPLAELRAFVPIWKRPWMTLAAATYGSSLLAALGVTNVFADAPDRYPEVTLEEAAAHRPDVVLAPSEPYPFRERHVPLLSEVAPVVLVDGQDLFWWGTRTPAALRRLAAQLSEL